MIVPIHLNARFQAVVPNYDSQIPLKMEEYVQDSINAMEKTLRVFNGKVFVQRYNDRILSGCVELLGKRPMQVIRDGRPPYRIVVNDGGGKVRSALNYYLKYRGFDPARFAAANRCIWLSRMALGRILSTKHSDVFVGTVGVGHDGWDSMPFSFEAGEMDCPSWDVFPEEMRDYKKLCDLTIKILADSRVRLEEASLKLLTSSVGFTSRDAKPSMAERLKDERKKASLDYGTTYSGSSARSKSAVDSGSTSASSTTWTTITLNDDNNY